MKRTEPVAVPVDAGKQCVYCDRTATGGERWIMDAEDWLYCSPLCYARVADGAVREEPSDSSIEFVYAFQLGLLTLKGAMSAHV